MVNGIDPPFPAPGRTLIPVVPLARSWEIGAMNRLENPFYGRTVGQASSLSVKNPASARTVDRVVPLGGRDHTRWFDKLEVRRHGLAQFTVSVPPLFRSLTRSPVNCQNQSRARPPMRVSGMVVVSVRTVRVLSL